MWLHATFTSPASGAVLTAYLTVNHRQHAHVLTRNSISGSVLHYAWRLTAADLSGGPQYVSVGLAAASGPHEFVRQRWEERLSAGPSPEGIAVQTPGYLWRLSATSTSSVWQQTSVANVMRLRVDQLPTAPTAP
jgi:hypothetical protein